MQFIGSEAHRRLDLVRNSTASGREGVMGRPLDSRSVSVVNLYLVHFEPAARARVSTQKSEEAGHFTRADVPKNRVLEGRPCRELFDARFGTPLFKVSIELPDLLLSCCD
jgi:hypothetical protein